MSFDSAGDVNVFLSSPRVGFREPPPATTTTSLLTFADMVLALDHKHIDISETAGAPSSFVEIISETDHTYASSGSSRTTRSQTAKAAALSSCLFPFQDDKMKLKEESGDDLSCESCNSNPASPTVSPELKCPDIQTCFQHLRGKRCSSVENLHHADSCLSSSSKACEWPQDLPKNSPRKSCSFEEVSCDNGRSHMKSSKSSENVQRTGVSHTLHRFVNNTLEFPCWPRKADHTYATATWDGTAASHSLFEQELHQDSTKPIVMEDQEMRDVEIDNLLQHSHVIQCGHDLSSLSAHHVQMVPQKDDHTYVKSNLTSMNDSGNVDAELQNTLGTERQSFSSATFPRQKMREDHTYFHSGLSRKNSAGSGGREWASTQTVGSSTLQQDLQIEEAYRNLQSFSQSASAKKDHNYSTSA